MFGLSKKERAAARKRKEEHPCGMVGPSMDDPGKPGSRYNPFTADKKLPKKPGSPKKPKKPKNGDGFDMDDFL